MQTFHKKLYVGKLMKVVYMYKLKKNYTCGHKKVTYKFGLYANLQKIVHVQIWNKSLLLIDIEIWTW